MSETREALREQVIDFVATGMFMNEKHPAQGHCEMADLMAESLVAALLAEAPRSDLREKVEGLRRDNPASSDFDMGVLRGYNWALKDVLALLATPDESPEVKHLPTCEEKYAVLKGEYVWWCDRDCPVAKADAPLLRTPLATGEKPLSEKVWETLALAEQALWRQHRWHLDQTTPDPEHGFIPADEYGDSTMYDETDKALHAVKQVLRQPSATPPPPEWKCSSCGRKVATGVAMCDSCAWAD